MDNVRKNLEEKKYRHNQDKRSHQEQRSLEKPCKSLIVITLMVERKEELSSIISWLTSVNESLYSCIGLVIMHTIRYVIQCLILAIPAWQFVNQNRIPIPLSNQAIALFYGIQQNSGVCIC